MSSSSTSAPERSGDVVRRFNPNVHGARGLFASMVLVYHVVNSKLPTLPLLDSGVALFFLRSFEHGVELFFGISGIVIFGALARSRSAIVFLIDRATRIYPVLWLSVLVIAALADVTHYEGRSVTSPIVLAANLLALPPLVPGPLIHPAAWSLSYELAFYALCGLTLAFTKRWKVLTYLVASVLALLILAWHLRALLMPVGLLVAFAFDRGVARFKNAMPGLWLLIFLVSWEALCRSVGGDLIAANYLSVMKGWGPALLLVALISGGLFFIGLMAGVGFLSSWLRTPVLQFLGTISYSLYLWHPIVMSLVKHAMVVLHVPERMGGFSQLIFLGLSAPPSLLVAWGSQRLLEKRATRWLRARLERRPQTTLGVAAACHHPINSRLP